MKIISFSKKILDEYIDSLDIFPEETEKDSEPRPTDKNEDESVK